MRLKHIAAVAVGAVVTSWATTEPITEAEALGVLAQDGMISPGTEIISVEFHEELGEWQRP